MVKDHRYSCLWLDGFKAGLNQRCFSSYRKLSPPLRQQTIKSSCTIKTGNGKGFEFCNSNSVLMIQTFWFPALCVVGITDHLCTGEAGVFNAGIWQQVVILAQPHQPLGQNGCRHRNTCNSQKHHVLNLLWATSDRLGFHLYLRLNFCKWKASWVRRCPAAAGYPKLWESSLLCPFSLCLLFLPGSFFWTE